MLVRKTCYRGPMLVRTDTLGDHLRKRRMDLGLRQQDVAERLGVCTDTVVNWEQARCEPGRAAAGQVSGFLEGREGLSCG